MKDLQLFAIDSEKITTLFEDFEKYAMEMANEYNGLTITDPKDKDQIKVVEDARREIKKIRADINKRDKEIARAVNTWRKKVINHAGNLLEKLDAVIDQLTGQIDHATEILENERKAAERAALEFFNRRTARLFEAGFTFNGIYYGVGSVVVEPNQIKTTTDDEFEVFIKQGKEQSDIIKKMLAAAEAEKIENERKAAEAEKIEVVHDSPFDEIPETPQVTEPAPDNDILSEHRPPGYILGFNTAKEAVIDILETSGKITRKELKEKVLSLRY